LLGWNEQVAQIDAYLQEKQAALTSENYRQELENALLEAGLSFEANFPVYRIPPFELQLDFEKKVVHLRLGRSAQKAGLFEPRGLAEWVKKHHHSVVKRRFNAHRFFRDLLSAYQVGNRLTYGTDKRLEILWGRAVALKQIYELLTLRAETRAEYPEVHFVYDLAQLRATGLTYDEYSLEFGYTRSVKRSFVIPDLSSRREERFSTLTIYRKEC